MRSRSASSNRRGSKVTQTKRVAVSKRPSQATVPFSGSPSPLDRLYADPAFQLEWANDLRFHLAEHVVALRRHRDMTQRDLADSMGTGQPHIARIEAGRENVTVQTIERLADALSGRICFAIEPAELRFAEMPPWWELLAQGMAVDYATGWGAPLIVRAADERSPDRLGAIWMTASSDFSSFPENLSLVTSADEKSLDAGILEVKVYAA